MQGYFMLMKLSIPFKWRHDIQTKDIQYNGLNCEI